MFVVVNSENRNRKQVLRKMNPEIHASSFTNLNERQTCNDINRIQMHCIIERCHPDDRRDNQGEVSSDKRYHHCSWCHLLLYSVFFFSVTQNKWRIQKQKDRSTFNLTLEVRQ